MGYIKLPRLNKRIQHQPDVEYPFTPIEVPRNSIGWEHLTEELRHEIEKIINKNI